MAYSIGLVAAVVAVAAFYLIGRKAGKAYLASRGTRVVTCPESAQPAAVEVDAWNAARSALGGTAELRLESCSRWPERQGCGQMCLAEIQADPHDCLVRTKLEEWYAEKNCAICREPFGVIHWHDHAPCLMDREGNTFEWNEVPPERLPQVLDTHVPICWNCHVSVKFRRKFPRLVVDRR